MNIDVLEKYYSDGLLHKQTHPLLDLTVWNYTPKVQYERLWDDVTKSCRGLITNSNGDIVARCIPKFFNLEELESKDIPLQPFTISEKMDGSYISLFYYAGQWIVASRGSFISEQAIKAREILMEKYNVDTLFKNHTYIFEILYPQNRIVVDYGNVEKLVMITAYETSTGVEASINAVKELSRDGFEIVKFLDDEIGYREIKSLIGDDQEGYVVRFKNGFRMKIKGDEYVRLHRILTNISNRDIWQYLKDGKPLDEILEKVPDEFYGWVKQTETDLLSQFNAIKNEVEVTFRELVNKKDYAEKVKDNKLKGFLFRRLDSYSKEYDDKIWDSIYPGYCKPFKKDVE